jgi:simple sugar transport system permease protein
MLTTYEKRLSIVLFVIVIAGSLIFKGEFLSVSTYLILAHQIPEYGLITLALLVVMIISGLNVSVVASATLAGIVGALCMNLFQGSDPLKVLVGICVMLIVGVLTGAINGLIVSQLDVPPILTTLGTMLFFQGISLNITKGGSLSSFPEGFLAIGSKSILGIPIPLLIFAGVAILLHRLLQTQEIGKQLYRIGKNKVAANFSGIPIRRLTLKVYVLSGILVGIAAVIMTARYNSIRMDYGSSYLINGIVAVSLGGADIKGGRGRVMGVVVALLIITVLTRLLVLGDVNAYLIDGMMGVLLLLNLGFHYKIDKNKDR